MQSFRVFIFISATPKGRRNQRGRSSLTLAVVRPPVLFPGTLAPSLVEDGPNSSSIDVIFATYWFYPAKTKAVLPDDQRCIDDLMGRHEQRFDVNSESNAANRR